MTSMRQLCASALLAMTAAFPVHAGPPFLTDDPEPVDYQHNEFYVFSMLDHADGSDSTTGPAIEYNRGIFRNTQFHVVLPFSGFSAPGSSKFGFGDIELGVKYRFVEESSSRPQIGIFPMVELDTGDATRNIGNGRTWYHLPLWIQKSWGPWTSYGGGGRNINHAPGMQDSWFAGWMAQRELGEHLTLGGELWYQGAQATDEKSRTLVNVGGYYNFTPQFSLLFSAGRSVAGEGHTVAYLGLYWTWGPRQ